nr:DNA replication protein [Weissella confusa]
MAQRRMFSKKVTDTDVFLDMPLSTQALYFHLNMHADDDGFVGNINTIKRMIGASSDDEKLLIAKQFLIPFEASGVVVIKDWRLHNYIRKDTYNPTIYGEDKKKLSLSENGSYIVDGPSTDSPRLVN